LKSLNILLSFFVLTSFNLFAQTNYYPTTIKTTFQTADISQEHLIKNMLSNVLNKFHIKKDGQDDQLVDHCGQNTLNGICYTQKVLGYHGARKILFGWIHLRDNSEGMTLKEVYCNKTFTVGSLNIGHNKIPSHSKVNCEHTWPQSKFSNRFPTEMQKSDLHHLYPTTSKANSIRGNFPFGDVSVDFEQGLCEASRIGLSDYGTRTYFEPPNEHKGNVARALFYFSIRYNKKINDQEEATLRRWNNLDPVDENEMKRNDIIEETQLNRNPFIDFPNLVDTIPNF